MAWWWRPEARGSSPANIVQHIKAIAPPRIIQNPNQPPLATTQMLSAIDKLMCPICLDVLGQPIQLPCDRLVCATLGRVTFFINQNRFFSTMKKVQSIFQVNSNLQIG